MMIDKNVFWASAEILKLDPRSEDYEFRVHAIIKKCVHYEKAGVYHDLTHWVFDPGVKNNLQIKCETHMNMMDLPDEKVVTYDVGNFKYNRWI